MSTTSAHSDAVGLMKLAVPGNTDCASDSPTPSQKCVDQLKNGLLALDTVDLRYALDNWDNKWASENARSEPIRTTLPSQPLRMHGGPHPCWHLEEWHSIGRTSVGVRRRMWWRIHDMSLALKRSQPSKSQLDKAKVSDNQKSYRGAPDSGSRIVLFDPIHRRDIDSFDQYVLDPGKLRRDKRVNWRIIGAALCGHKPTRKKWKTPVICQSATTSTAFSLLQWCAMSMVA